MPAGTVPNLCHVFLLQFLKIILSVTNWSFIPFNFLHPFCSSGNNLLLSRWSYSLSLDISVNLFHIRGKHFSLTFVTSCPFYLSFMINAVLPIVSPSCASFISKHDCNCSAILSWQDINAFVQYLGSPSGPRVFYFINFGCCFFKLSDYSNAFLFLSSS